MEYAICRDLEGDHFALGSHFDSPKSISAAPRPLPALSSCNDGRGDADDGDEEVYIDADFQFDLLLTDLEDDGRLIPADKIFFQGRIRPLYPFFDDDDDDDAASNEEENGSPVAADEALRLQASKGVAPESYCTWPPRSAGQHKKWPSMGGFLQRWQLGDLIFKRHRNGRKEKQEPPPPPPASAAAPHEAEKKAGKKKKAVEKRKDKKRRQ